MLVGKSEGALGRLEPDPDEQIEGRGRDRPNVFYMLYQAVPLHQYHRGAN
jgi:hypothetical protein